MYDLYFAIASPLLLDLSARCDIPDRPPMEQSFTHAFSVTRSVGCARRKKPVVVDGVLDEWEDLPIVCGESKHVRSGREAWTGPGDNSFRLSAEYDKEKVYIAVEVT